MVGPLPLRNFVLVFLGAILATLAGGCYSITNGWLDPTAVGRFNRTTSLEIRDSLSLEDTPGGLPGESSPIREDQEIVYEDYPISGGDALVVEIQELRDRGIPFQAQVSVANSGFVNLPTVGRVRAAGLTVGQFEEELQKALREKEILVAPEVTVNPQFLQKGTYSIFGIGVSASDNSPLRAGTFPVRRPDLRLLEAINQVGGLNEFVSDVYIFRLGISVAKVPEDPPFESSSEEPEEKDGVNARNLPAAQASEVLEKAADAGGRPRSKPEPLPNDPKRELFDVVEAGAKEEPSQSAPPTPRELSEPEPVDPFLWVNDEWVPNPARRSAQESSAATAGIEAQAPTPMTNWSRIAGESPFRIIRISADALRQGDPESNIFVRAGDVLRIVSGEIGVYYVMGQVNRPGPYRFEAEPVTLKSAIAVAGGLAGLAWPTRCTVYRRIGPREQMIQVNLDRIFAGQDPDFLVKRGDIVNVGTHPLAPFLQRIRAWTLPTPVNNVGYSFTYSRNFADLDSYGVRQNPANIPDRFPNFFP